MEAKIEFSATGTLDIDLTERELIQIINHYDGDFKKWAKYNYQDYSDQINFDIEIESCSLDLEKAKKITQDSLKHIDTFVREIDIEEVDINTLKQIEVDVSLLEKVSTFIYTEKDRLLPYSFLHLKENIIEATDTRIAVQFTNHQYNINECLFPVNFIPYLKQGFKLYQKEDRTLLLYNDGKYYTVEQKSGYHKEL